MLPIGFISAYLGVIAAELYPGLAPALALPKLIVSLHPLLAGLTWQPFGQPMKVPLVIYC